jgi:CHAT domain-containing protein/tetratricopeptide (TPR) repeat protein
MCFQLSAVMPSGNVYSHRQDAREQRGAGDEKGARALEVGKLISGELAGGRQHAYRIELNADQFLKVSVEQQGIDVVAQVSGPDGKTILEFDSESRSQGREEVSLVAEAAGSFQVIIRPRLNVAPAGTYEIRIEELRGATDTDRALHAAREQFDEALKLRRAGKHGEALTLAERALEIRERLLSAEHPDIANSICDIAVIYTITGAYAKAESFHQRALAIREKALGKDHPAMAESLYLLADLYRAQGNYAEAETLGRRAVEIGVRALGKDHPKLLYSLGALAAIYYLQGKYGEAEPLFKRVLEICEKELGNDHLDTAISLNNLALLHTSQGRYEEAEPLYQRSIEIREKELGKDNINTAPGLNNLALLYYYQAKYKEAELLFKRSLEINETRLSKDHTNVGQILDNLARVYLEQGKYAEAEPLFKRAIDIFEKSLRKNHPLTGAGLNDLAILYRSRGKYAEAEPLFIRALDIREKALGRDHPDTVKSLNNLAMLYTAKGDFVQAVKFQSLANAASERNLAYNLVIGSERDKLAYLATLSGQTDRTISLHLHSAPDDSVARNAAASLILQRKGRALDATSQNLNALRSRFNAEDQALLDRWTETRSQIARLALRGPQRLTIEQHQSRIKELEDQAGKYEADISRRSREFRAQSLPVTLEAVRAAIPDDSALIEFTSYRPYSPRAARDEDDYGAPRYVACVLRRDGEIECRELGDAKAIDRSIEALRGALRDSKRRDVKRLARVLDAKVFQPIRPILGAKSRLLISPDGSLNLIPFAALVDERWRYAAERYSISYLTSGRDLLRLQAPGEGKDDPLIVAAPDFGSRSQVVASHPQKQWDEASEEKVKEESSRSAIRELYFPPLPYAEQEGGALRQLLPGATLLTKGQATKASLSQIHGPRLLHIATHGFFLEDYQLTSIGGRNAQALNDDPERTLRELERRGINIENPLLRSGLALAGANEHREDDNGILTALEVTGLNLWGTKLVVLSACDTGVGEVKNGDGVYGLRRALVLAGAETQVMSLWAVSDKATRELMVAYYRRLRQGQGRGEALRQAQLEMLKNVNRRHPYYWASFIQSGEWADLEGNRNE